MNERLGCTFSPKKTNEEAKGTWKSTQTHQLSGKRKWKPQSDTTSHLSGLTLERNKKGQMLVKLWRTWNPALSLRVKNGIGAMENSMSPQKFKNRVVDFGGSYL
jgi:hypothetical protein